MQVFSTREIVTIIYISIIILYVFINKKIRSSAIDVLKCASSKKIVIPFFMIIIYACAFTMEVRS